MPKLLKLNLQFFADPPADPPKDPPPVKTFTQEEVDDILAKRLARVKNEPPADYEELKNKLKAFEDKDLSQVDKLLKQLADKESHATNLETKLNELTAKQKQEQINNAFKAAAKEAKIKYVDDAMKLVDMSAFTIGEDGKVEGLEAVVKKLAEEKPFLLSDENPEIGNPSNPGNPDRLKTLTKEQFQKMSYNERVQLHEKNPGLYKQLNTK